MAGKTGGGGKTEDRHHPAVGKARQYLEAGLEQGWWNPGQKLPSLARLSRSAGVSLVSAWKAAALLRREGRLESIPGAGIRVPSGAPDRPDPEKRVPPWQAAADKLRGDLASGRFAEAGPLPPRAQLAERYGVSTGTLRKALRKLERERILQHVRRDYHPRRIRPRRAGASITLVGAPGVTGEFGVFADRGREFLESLERHCRRAGLRLDLLSLAQGNASVLRALRRASGDLGCVVWPGEWSGRPETLKRIRDLVFDISRLDRPVAVFDEMGGFPLPERSLGRYPVQAFTIGSHSAGREMARHLLDLGHRRVAYVSAYHRHFWSTSRLEGMRQAFREAGGEARVIPLVRDEIDRQYNLNLELGGYGPGAKSDAGPAGAERTLERRMVAGLLRKASGHFAGVLRKEYGRTLSAELRPGTDDLGQGLQDVFLRMKYGILERAIDHGVDRCLEPLFERALEDKGITAWVGCNDKAALSALRFLEAKGRKAPAHLSVAGFDNSRESFEGRLTSFHFDLAAFAPRILDFLLSPSRFRTRKAKGGAEVEGILLERETTAPAFTTKARDS